MSLSGFWQWTADEYILVSGSGTAGEYILVSGGGTAGEYILVSGGETAGESIFWSLAVRLLVRLYSGLWRWDCW